MWTPIKVLKISGNSMKPYASDGDYAVATRIFLNIRNGDVLIFRSPVDDSLLIKRVKSIEASRDGPRFFMEGDNRMRSRDSNFFGPVPRSSIVGKVVYIAKAKKDSVKSA